MILISYFDINSVGICVNYWIFVVIQQQQQQQQKKNVKNVNRCRDGMPKSMQTRYYGDEVKVKVNIYTKPHPCILV